MQATHHTVGSASTPATGRPPAPARAQLAIVSATDAPDVVSVDHLEKCFGDIRAVDDVSFSVRRGEVFALLGPNGAGKSTTINVLCTLALPTGGTATVAGHDVTAEPEAVRLRIGLVFQEQTLDDQLTAEENLRFHAVMYRVPRRIRDDRIRHVLELVQLADRRRDLVSTFSGGMARRLEIARAMLHTPAVLFLDEPTVGLDPQTRALMWDDVLTLRREEGVSVLLTTHYMEEAEVADRIAIIDHGRVVALDSPAALKVAVGADTVELRTADDVAALDAVVAAGYDARAGDGRVTVFTSAGEERVADLVGIVGGGITSVHVHRPTLDDVFLHFTGREIREQGADNSGGMAHVWRARYR